MVIPICGTFDYVAIVPGDATDGLFQCGIKSRDLQAPTGDHLRDNRLVGHSPVLTIIDIGLPPERQKDTPWVMRSLLTLSATDRHAQSDQFSFEVDRALTRRMLPGDQVYLGRTSCVGLGLSILRRGELILAVGAITSVPLGSGVSVKTPYDLVKQAESAFRVRDSTFNLVRLPLEVTAGGESRILEWGRRTVGAYEIYVEHGFRPGIPGTDERAAMWKKGECHEVAMRASLALMGNGTVGH